MELKQLSNQLIGDQRDIAESFVRLLYNKPNTAYQYMFTEAILRAVGESSDNIELDLDDVFMYYANIAYDWCSVKQIYLGGTTNGQKGVSKLNDVVEDYVEKNKIKIGEVLSTKQLTDLASKIKPLSRWVKENVGSDSKGICQITEEKVVLTKEVQAFMYKYMTDIRETNELMAKQFLGEIEGNNHEVIFKMNLFDNLNKQERKITYWFAGANYDGVDFTQDFIKNGVYAIGWVQKDLKDIINDSSKMQEMYDNESVEERGRVAFKNFRDIKKGDMIALKKSYTEGENHSKSVLEINAVGEILEDITTGYKFHPLYRHTIPVKWTKVKQIKTGGGYLGTLTPCRDKTRIAEVFSNTVEGRETIRNSRVDEGMKERTKRRMSFNSGNLTQIKKYITNQGITYSLATLSNFYLSLKSKPFTILAGISGTGKSKLARLFAEAIGADFTLIPVKPDWSDATDLIGYMDLNQKYHMGKFIEVINRAKDNLDKPYIICLDEMNLARVEYYFSDFLSLIESRRWEGDKIITDSFNGEEVEQYSIPENVYIVGTVNMDETTFQFSKKVLDRANTIELSEVNLAYDFEEDETEKEEVGEVVPLHNTVLRSKYLLLKECGEHKELATQIINKLIDINEFLMPCGLQFAYRVRDEVVFYMLYNAEYDLLETEEAFDFQILQKVLPRINGTSERVRELIVNLTVYCINGEKKVAEYYTVEELEPLMETAIYPKSARKLLDMLRRYDEDGFTSFWF